MRLGSLKKAISWLLRHCIYEMKNVIGPQLLHTEDDNDVICYYSLQSVLPTPSCRSASRNRHWRIS